MPNDRLRSRCALTLAVLVASLLGGCDVKKVNSFTLTSRPLNNEFLLTNESSDSFDRIDLKITLWDESEIVKLERHWAYWKPGEQKSIKYTLAGGSLQRVEMTGVGYQSGELVEFDATFLIDAPAKK